MEEYPQLLNLNPMSNEWLVIHKVSQDRKLELRLGPPGEFLGYNNKTTHGTKRAFQHTAETKRGGKDRSRDTSENQCQKISCIEKTGDTVNCTKTPWFSGSTPYSAFQTDTKNESQHSKASFVQNSPISKMLAVMTEDFSQPCSSRMAELQFPGRKACSSLATADADTTTNNTSNKRYSPVVGWPPIRSFRKNLASNSLSKPASDSPNEKDNGGKPENSNTQLFIKINMEGIPIGRKVNLSAYNSYEELSLAIDELFSGLLAAQKDSSATQNENKIEELTKADADSFAGSGEYTLIYEDDEGDRMLVGDVPWHMFVSTAKRLHVLKSSALSTLRIGSNEKERTPPDPAFHI
ncbi:auxin-responsive protein IAA2-like [Durio zibethinus]|uniref:Auxin-responsive protein n=1 Tax=Durio zibethinus TaxID=66656 RepID=A0A6P5ZNY2_DURZI|nr:auxin-responsive protein IAA2-like [Durio zibethinus]XP_022754608.1 auxin-responsive protein IAA2-like [Durio zibethinus]XP_022754609.1 auxin-responsive protein IAA2-like [Durio zibethinus]